MTNRIV